MREFLSGSLRLRSISPFMQSASRSITYQALYLE